jgi:hypothetical protein
MQVRVPTSRAPECAGLATRLGTRLMAASNPIWSILKRPRRIKKIAEPFGRVFRAKCHPNTTPSPRPALSMITKSGNRFSEKIVLHQINRAGQRLKKSCSALGLNAEHVQLAVKRRAPDAQPARYFRHLTPVMRNGVPNGLGFKLLERPHVTD